MPEDKQEQILDADRTREIVAAQASLQSVKGAEQWISTLRGIISEYEAVATEGLKGEAAFALAYKTVMERPIETDGDYQSVVSLWMQAGDKVTATTEKFGLVTDFFYKVHRTFTGLRAVAVRPWEKWRDDLKVKAERWAKAQEDAKRVAKERVNRLTASEQASLQEQAQEQLAMGYVDKARDLLRQSEMAGAMVMQLPEAVPTVPGARQRSGYKATVIDPLALLKAVAEGKVKWEHTVRIKGKDEVRTLFVVDQVVVNQACESQQNSMRWPGVKTEPAFSLGRGGK